MLFLVTYSNCFEWNLLKEQTVINLSAMLLLKVHLCLLLHRYTLNNNYIHGIIFAVPDFQILEYQLV